MYINDFRPLNTCTHNEVMTYHTTKSRIPINQEVYSLPRYVVRPMRPKCWTIYNPPSVERARDEHVDRS